MELDTENAHGTPVVKESSAVINSIQVSDPIVDQEREQVRQVSASPTAPPGDVASSYPNESVEDGTRTGHRSRHDYSNNGNTVKRKETTFGHYILGQTLGEGEFGKVKLGWKRDGSIQVAIKLIRRDTLGTNPSRLPKIYREISILRELAHPNIVRLHEMVETDRHIGIIMEYASGGELFDYILNNRYLKDNSARRLFAQLVSGVGYLHKKGIVHRDLKLENLLLDRNRNIIITDFGFANTFDPLDPLEEEIEYNLTNKEYVKRKRLDKLGPTGVRRGDLMQTSCGSPCYAAPELVVSDSLYTGRKVDVWSCGVILVCSLSSTRSYLFLALFEINSFYLYSMRCWLAIFPSMTTQQIPMETTSIFCTNTLSLHLSHSPNMLHHTPVISLGAYLSRILANVQISSKWLVTAG
jgi:protein-serine/threonine kinase